MAPKEAEPGVGQVIAGRYELSEELARGGMGTVWIAHDDKLGRRVALKIMRPESLEAFPDARERFEREAKAAGALGTSHVVSVHDYGVENGTPFIAMELLEGESLKARLARTDTMDIAELAPILAQVSKGLKAAHKAGLVHRDLKPSNIFLAKRDDGEVVKLLDFGVVKMALARGKDETASGVLLGTPQYMSPEQARGLRQVDSRADLWSLAVILYTALTGENPFDSEAEAVGDIVIRVCIEPITSPSVINPDLPPPLDDFFDTALERDPDDRFQTVEELTDAFMLATDMSYPGSDAADGGSAPGTSGPHLRSSLPQLTSTPPPQVIGDIIDDHSSGSEMSASVSVDGDEPKRTRRQMVVMALVVAAGIGLGFWAKGLIAPNETLVEPAASASANPSASASTPPTRASATATVSSSAKLPEPQPSSSADPTTPPVVPHNTRQTATATADPDDKPPKWFEDD